MIFHTFINKLHFFVDHHLEKISRLTKLANQRKAKIFLSLLSILLTIIMVTTAANFILKKTIDEPYSHWTIEYSTFTPKYIYWQNFTCGKNQECSKILSKKESLLRLPIRKYNHYIDRNERLSILFLGDSFSTAPFAEKGYFDHFSEGLSSTLTQKNIESMILSSSGSGSSQQLAKFSDTVTKLSPDIVIWQFYWNDLYENNHQPIYKLKKDKLYRKNSWNNSIFLAGFLNQNIPFLKNTYLGKHILNRSFHVDLFHNWTIRKADHLNILEYNKKFLPAVIDQMETFSQKYEFKFYVTLSPLECQQIENQVCFENVELFQNELREILKNTGRFVSMEEFDAEFTHQLNSRNKIDKILFFDGITPGDDGFRHLSEAGERYFGEILFSNFNKKILQ
jgi:hypothetical protein